MAIAALGTTRPGAPLPRQLNYESDLLFHLRAADLLLGHDPSEDIARSLTGEDPAAFTRASAGGYTRDSLGRLRQWGKGIPRIKMFDLDGDGYWEEPGLLLEGARTNGFTKSIELDDGAWTKTRSSCAGGGAVNVTDAPDRTATADKLVEDGTAASTHFFTRNSPALTDNTQQSFSLFAKAAERTEILIQFLEQDGNVASVWFDLSAGTVGTETDAVGLIEKYADGWYRCMIVVDSDAGGSTPAVTVFLGEGSETNSYDGDGASGAYFWGMQFEVDQPFPSSFLLTAASTTARSADALTYTLAWLGQTITEDLDDLTVYARIVAPFFTGFTGIGANINIIELSSVAASVNANYFNGAAQIRANIDTATADAFANNSYPGAAGDVTEISAQFTGLRTGGSVTLDIGTGLGASGTGATAFSAFGDTTLTVGFSFTPLFDLKVARGLRTMKQMREAF